MKILIPLFISLALMCSCSPKSTSITKSDLVGSWTTTTDSEIAEGISLREKLDEVFFENGTYTTDGVSVLYATGDGSILVTISGPERGNWSIENGRIKKEYTEISISQFESNDSAFTRELFEEGIAAVMDEPEWLVPITIKANEITFEELEDGTPYTSTRKDNQSE